MTVKKDEKIVSEELEVSAQEPETTEEKPKAVPPKPPISRSGPSMPPAHQFRGTQGNNMNNRQRPGRAANRGR